MDELCAQVSRAVADGQQLPDPVRPRRGRDPRADPGAARHRGRAPPPDPRGHPLQVRPRHRDRARRARCTTSPCCSATAPARSTRTSRSRRLDDMIRQGLLPGLDHKTAVKNYIKALNKGVLKVISKMGISTIHSYRGAQIFEAIGLGQAFVDRYFTWTASRIGGVGLDVVAEEAIARHRRAYPERPVGGAASSSWGGEYQWRRDGEYHLFNPETVFQLQHATQQRPVQDLQGVHEAVDDQSRHLATLRGLLRAARRAGAGAARGGGAGRGDRQALRHRRHVLRLDQPRGARDAGDRHEPPRRQDQHRRGRRGSRALPARAQRRLAAQRHQAGGLRPLRRDQRVPGQRRRAADQDGPGRQARRGRPAARPQGLPVDRQGAPLDAGRGADLAAAAPRHLLDRGPGAADPRPEEREPAGAHQREAGGRGRASARSRPAWPRRTPTWC